MDEDNLISEAEKKVLDSLRDRGFAVCVFDEEEMRGVPADRVEDGMMSGGWNSINILAEEDEDEEEFDPVNGKSEICKDFVVDEAVEFCGRCFHQKEDHK